VSIIPPHLCCRERARQIHKRDGLSRELSVSVVPLLTSGSRVDARQVRELLRSLDGACPQRRRAGLRRCLDTNLASSSKNSAVRWLSRRMNPCRCRFATLDTKLTSFVKCVVMQNVPALDRQLHGLRLVANAGCWSPPRHYLALLKRGKRTYTLILYANRPCKRRAVLGCLTHLGLADDTTTRTFRAFANPAAT